MQKTLKIQQNPRKKDSSGKEKTPDFTKKDSG